jgi:hypothetical protein
VTDARIAQESARVLVTGTSDARIAQESARVLVTGTSEARIARVVARALITPTAPALPSPMIGCTITVPSSATSITVTTPVTLQAGDLLVAFAGGQNQSFSTYKQLSSIPTGWNQDSGTLTSPASQISEWGNLGIGAGAYYKVSNGTETTFTWTWGNGHPSHARSVLLMVFRGASLLEIVDSPNGPSASSAGSYTVPAGAVAIAVGMELIAWASGTITGVSVAAGSPGTLFLNGNIPSTLAAGDGHHSWAVSSFTPTAGVVVPSVDFTWSGTTNNSRGATTILVKPNAPAWSIWNGTEEVPATVTVWNGTTEVATTTEFAP